MSSSSPKVIRIGGFSAFWGDTSTGAAQLVGQTESIDYIIGDYLAEVTMGILGRGKQQVCRIEMVPFLLFGATCELPQ
jgi:hypothetical protein